VAHAVAITTSANQQIDHETRGLRYRAALAEFADGRATDQTRADLIEMGTFLIAFGGTLDKGGKINPADVALLLDLYGELDASIPLLVAAMKKGGALGDLLEGAGALEEHPFASRLLKAVKALTILHGAAEQYRESAAETDMGRVGSAVAVAAATGAILYLTAGYSALVVIGDELSGLSLVDGTERGTADAITTNLERQYTGDDRSSKRFEEHARDGHYGAAYRAGQGALDLTHRAPELANRAGHAGHDFVEDRIRSIRHVLGHSSHERSSW
jgi:hypothetical protein